MNKKGFMVTIEAVIAIVIVLIFMLTTLLPKTQEVKIPENIKLSQERIMQEIESREDLRQSVLGYPIFDNVIQHNDQALTYLESSSQRQQLNSFIKGSLNNPLLNFNYTVCLADNTKCRPEFVDKISQESKSIYIGLPNKQIYAKSIMISSSDGSRIFRLYLWESI